MRTQSKSLLDWVVHERDRTCLYGFWYASECRFGLDPHHIIKRSSNGGDVKENIITLCRKHHDLAEANIISADSLRDILKGLYNYDYENEQRQGQWEPAARADR